MLRGEIARLAYSRLTRILAIVLFATSIAAGVLVVFLRQAIKGLIGLNEVIPNATQANQLSSSQLSVFGFDQISVQANVADIAGGAGFGVSTGVICAVLFGMLSVTAEYRRGSIVHTTIAQPKRLRLAVTKLGALMICIVATSIVLVVLKGLLLALGVLTQGTSLLLSPPELFGIWIRGGCALILFGLMGAGIGFLLRSQVTALIFIFVAIVVESSLRPISALVFQSITPVNYLPFGLVADAVRGPGLTGMDTISISLGIGIALAALVGWATIALVLGCARFVRTDVPANS